MFKSHAVSGMIWASLGQFGATGISTIFVLIFARFLSPSDFGIFAIGALIVGLTSKVADLGLSTTIVQRDQINSLVLSTAFWLVLLASISLAIVIILTSFLVFSIVGDYQVGRILPLLLFGMVLNSMNTLLTALLRRDLKVSVLAKRTFLANLLSGVLATPLALKGYGVAALVAQFFGGAVISIFLTYLLLGWPVKLQFDRKIAREILGFGYPVMKADLLQQFNLDSPKFFVGAFLGTSALGIFSMAMRLLNLICMVLGVTLSTVFFPLLSEINRTDPARLYEIYRRIFRLVITVYLPIFLLCAVLSREIVVILLGPDWSGAADITALLFISGILVCIRDLNGGTAMAIGYPELRLRFVGLAAIIGSVLLTIFTPMGLTWVGVAMIVRNIVSEYFMTRSISKKFRSDWSLGSLLPVVPLTSAFALIGTSLVAQNLMLGAADIATVIVCVVISMSAYLAIIRVFDQRTYSEVASIILAVFANLSRRNTL